MKTMKHVLALLLALTLVCTLLAGCGTKKIGTEPAPQTGTQSESGEKTVKIGLIVGTGGLGDQNFNDLAYNGLLEAQKLYGIEFDYSEPQSASDYASYITQYAEDGSYTSSCSTPPKPNLLWRNWLRSTPTRSSRSSIPWSTVKT